jgi:hypothetical protein
MPIERTSVFVAGGGTGLTASMLHALKDIERPLIGARPETRICPRRMCSTGAMEILGERELPSSGMQLGENRPGRKGIANASADARPTQRTHWRQR